VPTVWILPDRHEVSFWISHVTIVNHYYIVDIIVQNIDDNDGNDDIILAVVEVIILSIYDFFVEIWRSKVNSGRQFRILGVALVESIDKRWIFGFETITNR